VNKTDIEWTDLSANPLKYRRKSDGKTVWACVKTSPGCKACYAEAIALRFDRGRLFNAKNMEELEPFLDEAELRKMLTAKTVGGVPVAGSCCFVGDMTDLLGEWVPDDFLDALFAVLAVRSDVTWQVLTKRAGRMAAYFGSDATAVRMARKLAALAKECDLELKVGSHPDALNGFLLPNVWLGISVEDQQRADERIPLLCRTPAAVRFLSVEPMLGPINLHMGRSEGPPTDAEPCRERADLLHWIIVGGESGPHARPCDVAWIRSIVEQCRVAGVPPFVKQVGSHVLWDGAQGGYGDGPSNVWPEKPKTEAIAGGFHVYLKDSKGGDPAEWPEDCRVRQFPTVRT
jgi:protein gp37